MAGGCGSTSWAATLPATAVAQLEGAAGALRAGVESWPYALVDRGDHEA